MELARLIVAPDRRGQGVGRVLTALLLARAKKSYPAVFLRVHPANQTAQRCYQAAGFTRVPAADEERFNEGQPVAYAWFAG